MTKAILPRQIAMTQPPSTRLHLWLKPPKAEASMPLGSQVLAHATAPGFTLFDLAPGIEGKANLTWNPTEADGMLYGFDGASGITVLHLTRAARRDLAQGSRFRLFMGWMNDPNDFCRAGAADHLFYPHQSHALRWSDMPWGHAASTDLIHWTDQPILLIPGQPPEFQRTALVPDGITAALATILPICRRARASGAMSATPMFSPARMDA